MEHIELTFSGAAHRSELSLSGVAVAGLDQLFVAPDEGRSVLRMSRHRQGFRSSGTFAVEDFVPVDGDPGDEIDLEGMDVVDGVLWIVGSHGRVRTRIKRSTPDSQVPDLLAEVDTHPSRRLLARIPLVDTADGPQPARTGTSAGGSTVRAASLVIDGLHTALRHDRHLAPFLALPGKDNGLDVEGLAVVGDRVLLGLRGPVLRGWAVVLEITPRPAPGSADRLRIEPPVVHFLDLGGLGIRDLTRDGADLLVLAGPTMLLDGPSRVLRIHGAGEGSLPTVVRAEQLEQLGPDLAVGQGEDHPEGIAMIDRDTVRKLLVIYDSPAEARVDGSVVRAELG
jgi:hypothetical protein